MDTMGEVTRICYNRALIGPRLNFHEIFHIRCGQDGPTHCRLLQFLDPCPVTIYDYNK